MSGYQTPRALEMAVKEAAKASSLDTNRAIAGFYFHRFLCRVFSDSDSSFVLKGGLGMLARTTDARYTRDIDLTTSALDIESAIEKLKALARIDLHDFVSFIYLGCVPIRAEDEYRDGYSATFDVYLGAKKMQSFSIDLVADSIGCVDFDKLSPADRIDVRGLYICDYLIYSSTRAIADKICGIIERHDGKPSSRVKDLVDIAVYAGTEDFDARVLNQAIAKELAARRIPAPCVFELPTEWGKDQEKRYEKLAMGTRLNQAMKTMPGAIALSKTFLDPILDKTVVTGTWSCNDARWRA